MITEEEMNLLSTAFTTFINHQFESVKIPDDPLEEAVFQKGADDKQPKDAILILQNEKIVFLDFMYMRLNFPLYKGNNIDSHSILDKYLLTEDAFQLIRFFKQLINDMEFFNQFKLDPKTKFEFRFTNYGRLITFEDVNSYLKNQLVTIRGTIFHRWDTTGAMANARIWECLECGHHKKEIITRGAQRRKFKKVCNNLISEGENGFPCNSRKYQYIEDTDYEDIFQVKIEALPDDTANKIDPPTFTIELTNNLCNKTFINQLISGESYEFTGFIQFITKFTQNKSILNLPFLKLMSFKPILKRVQKIYISDEERIKIIEFLKRPDSIEQLSKMFGLKVIGFNREKKFFLIMKTLQELYNKSRKNKNPKEYLTHMLVVGDFSTGKSEFAEVCHDFTDNGDYIIGSSTTGVGLTGATIRDEFTGKYSIQSGKLARTSGDTLIIEEFDKQQNKEEFGVINEAMSKFEYTVTKAGTSRKFLCNTTMIVIANPINKKFDMSESLYNQIDIEGDLLSRFTVISCIIDDNDIEKELLINKIMLQRNDEELLKQEKINTVFIKKCIKIATEIDPVINDYNVLTFVNNWTKEAYGVKKNVEGYDKKFWENLGTSRNRSSLMKIIKGVAMLHMNEIPTKEDMIEATQLFYDFQKDIIKTPMFMNIDDLTVGRSFKEIEEDYKKKFVEEQWEMKVENKKDSKKGKIELLMDYAKQQSEKNGKIDIELLKKEAISKFNYTDYEFEDILEKLKVNGDLYEVNPGFVKAM